MAPVVGLLPLIGAVASAGGAVLQGISASESANYQAQVAKNNAIIANDNATRAMQAGQQKAQDQSLKNAETEAAIVTSQAANGVDVNSGSNVDVQASQRAKGQLDSETTLNNAQQIAYGYRTQAVSDTAQAGLDQATAENAPIGAVLGATGSLLGNSKFTGSWIGGTDSSGSSSSGGSSSVTPLGYGGIGSA